MSDILIRGYKAKEQIEEIIREARYGANNCMIGSGLEVIELPPHGDLISRDDAIIDVNERGYDFWNCYADIDSAVLFLNEQPVIVPASEEATNDPKP